MDVQMPMMDGFECCEAIRQRSDFRDIHVMFLSAYGSRENIAKSYQSGANLFLNKPVEPERLLRNVDLFFEKSPEPAPAQENSACDRSSSTSARARAALGRSPKPPAITPSPPIRPRGAVRGIRRAKTPKNRPTLAQQQQNEQDSRP